MTRNSWIIFAVICIGFIGGLIWVSQGEKVNVDDIDVSTIQQASDDNGNIGEHTLGNKDAKVVVIEYADYQCPGCRTASPGIKQAVEKHRDDVLLVFRNFPLPTLHPNARAAAAAAEAAGLQGKFWQMHEHLFETQSDWGNASIEQRTAYFTSYAENFNLDIDRFTEDMSSAAVEKKIDFDRALATKSNLTGTPSVFVNGKIMNQKVLNGKIVSENEQGGSYVWSDAELFETHALLPALKEAGVKK